MQFKFNFHKARKYKLHKVEEMIKNYNKKYPTPKYLLFIKKMIEEGWEVKVYVAKVSKYVFVTKQNDIYKIRFSNHKPLYAREDQNDCDFYVGISHKQVSTTEQIINKILGDEKEKSRKKEETKTST